MKTHINDGWISAYIYYSDSADRILVNAVGPLLERLKTAGQVKQFFFIRYNDERGLHIRLRILPSEAADRPAIEAQVEAAFDVVTFVAYEPEIERYGGPSGIDIAEQLFEASSRAVLELIAGSSNWNYSRAMASALQMHVGMLHAFGVSRAELISLFAHIAEEGIKTADRRQAFAQGFDLQRQAIVRPLIQLWQACGQGANLRDDWFRKWYAAMKAVGKRVAATYQAGQLELPDRPVHDDPRWYLYESYIHMTNNRLGLSRTDESFGAYLLQRSLASQDE